MPAPPSGGMDLSDDELSNAAGGEFHELGPNALVVNELVEREMTHLHLSNADNTASST